jgi:hypothetical protein
MDAIRAQERADHFRQEAKCCGSSRAEGSGKRSCMAGRNGSALAGHGIKAEAAEQFASDVAALHRPLSREARSYDRGLPHGCP